MKCELAALVECSDMEKMKYWERNLWLLMALSLEDKQSQLKTDHLPSSGWEIKVAWSCVLSYPYPYVPSWHVVSVINLRLCRPGSNASDRLTWTLRSSSIYICVM
jgi:hypothetical protein